MPRILYVATVVKTHIMEFHVPYLKMLKEMGWETAVAARNDYENPKECNIPYCDIYYDVPFERKPLRFGNIRAYRVLKKIIDNGDYDIIHCHTPVGAMIARIAAVKARKKGTKVIYTAHGFHFYKGAPVLNWMLYYPVEKILARSTDALITINREDYKRAKRFKIGKVYYIPGVGLDTNRFTSDDSVRCQKRDELGIGKDIFALLSVGELVANKNHKVVIDALEILKRRDELTNIKYFICGRGQIKDQLEQLIIELDLKEHVILLGYRSDIAEICNASDLFIFMSLREGLPVALMEAMACGLPVICSNIRGNTDLVKDGRNGRIIPFSDEILAETIIKLKNDERIRNEYGRLAKKTVKRFDLSAVVPQIKKIYLSEMSSEVMG